MSTNYNGYSLPVDEPILDQDVKPGDYHHSTDPRGIDTYIVEVPALPGEQPHYAEVPVATGVPRFFDVAFGGGGGHVGPAPQILPHENNYYFDISYDTKGSGHITGSTLHDPSVLENHAQLTGTFDDMVHDLVSIFTPSLLHDPSTGQGLHATRTAGVGTDYGWGGQSQSDQYIINYDDHQTLLHALLDAQLFPQSFFNVSFGGGQSARAMGMSEATFADLRAYIVEHIPHLATYDSKSHSWSDGLPTDTPMSVLVHNYTDLMQQTIKDPTEYFKWEIDKLFYHMGYDNNQNFQTAEIQSLLGPALRYLGQEELNQRVQAAFNRGATDKAKDDADDGWGIFAIAAGVLLSLTGVGAAIGGAIVEATGVAAATAGMAIGDVALSSVISSAVGNAIIGTALSGGDVRAGLTGALIGGVASVAGAYVGGAVGNLTQNAVAAQIAGTGVQIATSTALNGGSVSNALFQAGMAAGAGSVVGAAGGALGIDVASNVENGIGSIISQAVVDGRINPISALNAFAPTRNSQNSNGAVGPANNPDEAGASGFIQSTNGAGTGSNNPDEQSFVLPPSLQQISHPSFNASAAQSAMNNINNYYASLGDIRVNSSTTQGITTTTIEGGSASLTQFQDGSYRVDDVNGRSFSFNPQNQVIQVLGTSFNEAFATARASGSSAFLFDKGDGKGLQPYNTQLAPPPAPPQPVASAAPASGVGGTSSTPSMPTEGGRGTIIPPTVNSPEFAIQQAEQNNTGRGTVNPPTVNSPEFQAQQAAINARATGLQPAAYDQLGSPIGGAPVTGADSSAAAAFNNSAAVNAVTNGVKYAVDAVSNTVNLVGAATGTGADGATKQLYGSLANGASNVWNGITDGTYANQLAATAQRNAANLDTFNSNFVKDPNAAIVQGSQQFENAINHLTTEPVLNGAQQLGQPNQTPSATAGALFQIGAGLLPGAQVVNDARAGANAVTRGLDAASGSAGSTAGSAASSGAAAQAGAEGVASLSYGNLPSGLISPTGEMIQSGEMIGTKLPTPQLTSEVASADAAASAAAPYIPDRPIPMNVSGEVAPSSVVTATSANATWQDALNPAFRSEIYTPPADLAFTTNMPSLSDPYLAAKFDYVAQQTNGAVNMNALYAGSNSSSLQGLISGDGLISSGGMRAQGIVPFNGEGSVFNVGLGADGAAYHPNVFTVSTTTAADLPVALSYTENIYSVKGWTPQASASNEVIYNQLGQSREVAQQLGYSPTWEAARREVWPTLTPEQQQLISNPFPVLYEINPVNRTVADFAPNQVGESAARSFTEIGLAGGATPNEISAVYVPAAQVDMVKNLLATSGQAQIEVRQIETIQGLAQQPRDWSSTVVDYMNSNISKYAK